MNPIINLYLGSTLAVLGVSCAATKPVPVAPPAAKTFYKAATPQRQVHNKPAPPSSTQRAEAPPERAADRTPAAEPAAEATRPFNRFDLEPVTDKE